MLLLQQLIAREISWFTQQQKKHQRGTDTDKKKTHNNSSINTDAMTRDRKKAEKKKHPRDGEKG